MQLDRITTPDGSWTFWDRKRKVSYRSVHGAATESDHVFVAGCGLGSRAVPEWRVLELGFGAAMNFHRTRLRCADLCIPLRYVAIERDPLPASLLNHDPATDDIVGAALADVGTAVTRGAVSLTVHVGDITTPPTLNGIFDAFYHDPFGPQDDPEAWDAACFAWYRAHAAPAATLATYAVAGEVRRALQAAGWVAHKRPGPPGKREVLTAVVNPDAKL